MAWLVARFGPTAGTVAFWAGIVLCVLVMGAVAKCTYDRGAKTEIKLSKGQAGAAIESGRDAVDTVGNVAANASASDQLSRENENDIRKANGAGAPVDPGVNGAGLNSLCKRASYRLDPKCLQRAAPR